MKRKRSSVEQIVAVVKQYAVLQSDHVRELKQLQEENARLKKPVAELSKRGAWTSLQIRS